MGSVYRRSQAASEPWSTERCCPRGFLVSIGIYFSLRGIPEGLHCATEVWRNCWLFTYAHYYLTTLNTCQGYPQIEIASDPHMASTPGFNHHSHGLLDYSQHLSHDTTPRHIGTILNLIHRSLMQSSLRFPQDRWSTHTLQPLLSVHISGLACTYKKTWYSL